jgi:ABC-type multidrug transport system fused ATPase/permease subunit
VGLAAGLAAGTKLNFLLPAAVLVLGVALVAPRGLKGRAFGATALAALAGGGYWYLRNLAHSGNPLPWIHHLGPIDLPAPEQALGGREAHSVLGYLTDGDVWSTWFLPGLHHALWPLWPLLLAAALAGLLLPLLAPLRRRDENRLHEAEIGPSAEVLAAPALSGVDLSVEAGKTVALVGPSGSGKTSLVGLIARLYDPSGGTVLVDGADVRDVDVESLRSQIAFVADDSFLFTASVAENIAYAHQDASLEQIEAAARRAQADAFIRELPDGYETRVGERGLTLSGGQRQRVAIARALLADPRILILDDATSSVDATTEAAIKAGLREAMAGRTTFIIAHRLSTVSLADEIVVMDGGSIVDRGTHEELLAGCGFYREIAEHGLADSVFLQRDLEQREEMAKL